MIFSPCFAAWLHRKICRRKNKYDGTGTAISKWL
jgi:hypothetical protein